MRIYFKMNQNENLNIIILSLLFANSKLKPTAQVLEFVIPEMEILMFPKQWMWNYEWFRIPQLNSNNWNDTQIVKRNLRDFVNRWDTYRDLLHH